MPDRRALKAANHVLSERLEVSNSELRGARRSHEKVTDELRMTRAALQALAYDREQLIRDVLATVAFLWSPALPERICDALNDPDEDTMRRVRELLLLRRSNEAAALGENRQDEQGDTQ